MTTMKRHLKVLTYTCRACGNLTKWRLRPGDLKRADLDEKFMRCFSPGCHGLLRIHRRHTKEGDR